MNLAKEILTSNGESCLFSLGQAGFILKNREGKVLGIDLYLSDFSERDEGHVGFKRLLPKLLKTKDVVFDYLIATHPHSDHFDYDSMSDLMSNDRTCLYASEGCRPLCERLGISERIEFVKPGCNESLSGFDLEFVNCDHGTSSPDAFGVIVNMDGLRILEVGDTCLRLDRVPEYNKNGNIDVLIAPINGAFGNMDEHDCALLSATLKPLLTVPCHYGMFASHFGSPGKFIQEMAVICPQNKFLLMSPGEKLVLK